MHPFIAGYPSLDVRLTLKVPPTHRPPTGHRHPPTIKATYRQRINSHESAAGELVVGDDVIGLIIIVYYTEAVANGSAVCSCKRYFHSTVSIFDRLPVTFSVHRPINATCARSQTYFVITRTLLGPITL